MIKYEFKIFISYATPDRNRVTPFFDYLASRGYNVWMDCKKLLPGQIWDEEIKRAFNKSKFFISFISHNSCLRRGYVQREVKMALQKKMEMLPDDVYIVPVVLDNEVSIPEYYKDIHCVSVCDGDWMFNVEQSMVSQIDKYSRYIVSRQEESEISWTTSVFKEEWGGLPGYSADIMLMHFQSLKYPLISQVGDVANADQLNALFGLRSYKIRQEPDFFSYEMSEWLRTDAYDAVFSEPCIHGDFISFYCTIYHYGAGAAHGNHNFKTYNYLLGSMARVEGIKDIFKNDSEIFSRFQKIARMKIVEEITEIDDVTEDSVLTMIQNSSDDWSDFDKFIFSKDGILIFFDRGSVLPTVYGPRVISIGYDEIVNFLRREFIDYLKLPE